MGGAVINIEGLWKQYRLGVIGHGTLYHDLQSWWARMRGKKDPNLRIAEIADSQRDRLNGDRFWALRDISFDVPEGSVTGLIGRNGAGKSTILKVLSRVTAPTKGVFRIKGRLASLLEVGTGFHPELTGRENIYLNGSILGMSGKEIRKKFDEIVDFAEIEDFLETPVKRYSSGMYVRLAFAVAAHLEPEILLVDEVLAVGDYEFQKKCLNKIENVSSQGRTILFVSHNIGSINKLCDRCIVLEAGRIAFDGPTLEATQYYLNPPHKVIKTESVEFKPDNKFPAQLLSISTYDKFENLSQTFFYEDGFEIRMVIQVNKPSRSYYANFVVHNAKGEAIFFTSDSDLEESFIGQTNKKGLYQYRVRIPGRILKPGQYSISPSIGYHIDNDHEHELWFEIIDVSSRRAVQVGGYRDTLIAPEIEWRGQIIA
jgi:lipopolysaccharide transport system ATP-binding protein